MKIEETAPMDAMQAVGLHLERDAKARVLITAPSWSMTLNFFEALVKRNQGFLTNVQRGGRHVRAKHESGARLHALSLDGSPNSRQGWTFSMVWVVITPELLNILTNLESMNFGLRIDPRAKIYTVDRGREVARESEAGFAARSTT